MAMDGFLDKVCSGELAAGFELPGRRSDVPRSVVHQAVDAKRAQLAVHLERWPVTDVSVPQGTGPLRTPAKARLASRPIAQADAVQALLGEEAANVEQKLPLLGMDLLVVFDFGGKKRCCDSACRSASPSAFD